MSNPGNKRRHRALAGASPSSDRSVVPATVSGAANPFSLDHRGVSVQRTKGSVVNNGGNMMQGTFPTVGVAIPFLMKLGMCCRDGNVPTPLAPKD